MVASVYGDMGVGFHLPDGDAVTRKNISALDPLWCIQGHARIRRLSAGSRPARGEDEVLGNTGRNESDHTRTR